MTLQPVARSDSVQASKATNGHSSLWPGVTPIGTQAYLQMAHCSQWPGVTPCRHARLQTATAASGHGLTPIYTRQRQSGKLLKPRCWTCPVHCVLSCGALLQFIMPAHIYIYTVYIHVLLARSIVKVENDTQQERCDACGLYNPGSCCLELALPCIQLHSAWLGPRIVLRSSHGGAPAGTTTTKVFIPFRCWEQTPASSVEE